MSLHPPVKDWKKYKVTSAIGNRQGGFHKGIDLATPIGVPAYAIDNMTITHEGVYGKLFNIPNDPKHPDYPYRNEILIWARLDNGWTVKYAHLNETVVNIGERVQKGKFIGSTGNTGNSSGAHLHLEISDSKRAGNAQYIDFREHLDPVGAIGSIGEDPKMIVELQQQIAKLQADTQASINSMNGQLSSLARQNNELTKQLESSNSERNILKAENINVTSAFAELKIKYESVAQENEGYKIKIDNLEKMVDKLTDDIHDQNSDTQKLINRNNDLETKIEAAKGLAVLPGALTHDQKPFPLMSKWTSWSTEAKTMKMKVFRAFVTHYNPVFWGVIIVNILNAIPQFLDPLLGLAIPYVPTEYLWLFSGVYAAIKAIEKLRLAYLKVQAKINKMYEEANKSLQNQAMVQEAMIMTNLEVMK